MQRPLRIVAENKYEGGGMAYPARFEYFAPTTLDEALGILERSGDEAKVLAGGQSLIPVMKLRLAAPRVLVDLNRIPDLDYMAGDGGFLRIGPLVRHKDCERSTVLEGRYGVLGDAAPQISDPIVRNRGTVAGSVAHADPQGDWGSALLAAGAELVVRSATGERTIPLKDFFVGPFMTTLQPTEVIAEIRVPDPGPHAGGTYLKLERKVGDFATIGVAVHVSLENGSVGTAGIAVTGAGPTNVRASSAEAALADSAIDDATIDEVARLAAQEVEPFSDVRGSAEYKRQVVRVFTERGLRTAIAAARGDDA
jgi:carbon-monoxide dehydrogenase medium subunit